MPNATVPAADIGLPAASYPDRLNSDLAGAVLAVQRTSSSQAEGTR